jgi:hypothetical protein
LVESGIQNLHIRFFGAEIAAPNACLFKQGKNPLLPNDQNLQLALPVTKGHGNCLYSGRQKL